MKKYIFMRILRSLVSIFMVTTLTYTIIYTMVPRKLIFKQDPNYNKIATTPDKKTNYENTIFERMGYIDYYDTKELQEKASKENPSVTVEPTNANKKSMKLTSKSWGVVGNCSNSKKVSNFMQLERFQFMNAFLVSMAI